MFDNTENGTIIEDANNVEVIPSDEIRNSEGTGITMVPNECDINDIAELSSEDNVEIDNNLPLELIENRTNIEVVDESKDNKVKVVNMESMVPAGISKRIIERNGKSVNLANLVFICKDTSGDIFTLGKNYCITTKEENDMIEALPFYNDDKFENYKASVNLLVNTLESYSSEFEIKAESDFVKSSEPRFSIDCKDISNNTDVKIYMKANHMDCLKFIDSYIYEGINNNHDLALASTLSLDNIYEDIFLVDKIESIVSMAPAINKKQKKDIKSIGVVLKLSNFISIDEKEISYLLIPFETATGYNIKKFKDKSIDDIMDSYYGDSDQYLSRLLIDKVRISGVDKEYMIVKACSKDNRYRMFLFDNATREELIKMIDEY